MHSFDQPIDFVTIDCPYCGEAVEIAIEGDVAGEMVIDCQVCCRPWNLSTERDANGGRLVNVQRDE